MTSLTEADLLAMREVQAKATPGPWSDEYVKRLCRPGTYEFEITDLGYCVAARTAWPRVTEWALEARKLLERYVTGKIGSAELDRQARRLLGEP